MENIEVPAGSIRVVGTAELAIALDELLVKCTLDLEYAAREHYVFYQLGSQKALIKIDMSVKPYQFWYGDYLGRPATRSVKETIARFLYEKCGEKAINFQEDVEHKEE